MSGELIERKRGDGEGKADCAEYLRLHPGGEAKTVRVGFMRVPFWRCRPVKGHGSWSPLPRYALLRASAAEGAGE